MKETEEYRRGVMAMFDQLTYRAANHYHGNPEVNKICQKENELIWQWTMDALEQVSDEDYEEMLKFYPQYR